MDRQLTLSSFKKLTLLFIDDNLEINNINVLKINYDIDMHKYTKNDLSDSLNNNIENICKKSKDDKYILLLDCSNMNNNNFDLIKLKYIIGNMSECLTKHIYKCIMYNYTDAHKIIINMILLLINDENKEKVIFRKNFSEIYC